MRNFFLIAFLLALPLLAQIDGVINSSDSDRLNRLSVQLIDIATHRVLADVPVYGNGAFQLPPQAAGFFELRVVDDTGSLLYEREIHTAAAGTLAIQLASPKPVGLPGPISVGRLSHKTPKAALKQFTEAQKSHQAKDRKRAIEHLKAAVALDPQYFDALSNLGALYLQNNDLDAAKLYLDRARGLDSSDSPNNTNLSAYYAQRAEYARAEEFARLGLRNNPSSPRAHYMLAFALIRQGKDIESARQHLSQIDSSFGPARSLLLSLAH